MMLEIGKSSRLRFGSGTHANWETLGTYPGTVRQRIEGQTVTVHRFKLSFTSAWYSTTDPSKDVREV